LIGEGERFLRGAPAPLRRLLLIGGEGIKLRDMPQMILGGRVGIDIQGKGVRGEVILPWKDNHMQTVPIFVVQSIFGSSGIRKVRNKLVN